ncbi:MULTISPECIES: EF-hand domain-containing protein [unclassified Pseudoalteromonas]|uniref:EF-hand domain-containing protein n=1 Tax=unclassified Pseudoalteromonas TaxID=194690 RepID=UPI0011089E0E|nr:MULTISPECIES: EF-hand domain-containing protein [unclassified Pseudoalteromonas]MCF2899890.1 EF-hand domain-containing protein [Pseudoalteromonas sp. OFAV1]TMO40215.1 calcium-binding protein [Pseudoalteromonas sp. S4389]
MKHLSALSVLAISLLATAPACFARDHQGGPPPRPDFPTIDIDGNGVIDFTEFSEQPVPEDMLQTIFNDMDADQNGEVTEDEFNKHKPPKRKENQR